MSVSKLYVSKLCVSKLYVSKLCVSKLCVSNMYKLGAKEAVEGGGGRRERTTKNKNPTQRCGEKQGYGVVSDPRENPPFLQRLRRQILVFTAFLSLLSKFLFEIRMAGARRHTFFSILTVFFHVF